jgi:hypothetical protein
MPTCIPGEVFVFQALFVDSNAQPVVVTVPTITVYRFASDGSKVILVDVESMTVVTGETNRYVYPYLTPESLTTGGTLYGEIRSTVVGSGAGILYEIAVDLVPAPVTVVCGGLVAQFVRP